MKRPLLTWLVFATCALTGLGVLGWFSGEMLRLERGAAQAREIAAREESVRLALWRMDSALAAVHGLEAARPPSEYAPFLPLGAVFTRDLAPAAGDAALVPSPLLGFTPPFVRLHLQIEPNGRLTSPQSPEGPAHAAALRAAVPPSIIAAAATRLDQLRRRAPTPALLAALDAPPAVAFREAAGVSERDETPPSAAPAVQALAPQAARQANEELKKSQAEQQQRAELAGEGYYNTSTILEQRARGLERKFSLDAADAAQADAAESAATAADAPGARSQPSAGVLTAAPAPTSARLAAKAKAEAPAEDELVAGPLQALWVGDDLFLLRRVDGADRVRAQAVWLDWPELRAWLLARVVDLLPEASLESTAAIAPATADDASRRLAFLPVRLRPGAIATGATDRWSPLEVSLAIAWAFAGVGVVALALLLAGTLRLSERRGAFVSAVTHELRTPLTTFRMYTEMLSGGMVPDPAKRDSYLDTLRKEAERLSHLVENVLSYARLERGRASRRIEDTTPGDLLARIEERLRQRAEQGGLALSIELAPDVAALPLRTDTTAFEQIIFNLVDNAAKYARRPDGNGTLTISVAAGARGRTIVRVSDDGPGIATAMRRRLFQPFSKSAAEAAHSQPGVGLGLALSRRLARDELHGELALERTGPEGTVFRLEF